MVIKYFTPSKLHLQNSILKQKPQTIHDPEDQKYTTTQLHNTCSVIDHMGQMGEKTEPDLRFTVPN